ncbi:MAG: ABC transporter ATP-binding protein [Calditrichia bacterium]
MNAIEIQNFSKSYGDVEAVKNVSLSIGKGELFGVIGPDGAGKTTLMRSVVTLLLPTAGSIVVNGLDVTKNTREIRSGIGYMPQRFSLYQDLTVEQNLGFFADIFQVPVEERAKRLDQLYRFSRLEPFKKRLAGALSGGMKQKLALSCALIHTPEILVLDEPTFGVDPVSRQEFWDILRSIRQEGTTIFVSTAYMDEADQCDRVALFNKGKILALDAPDALKHRFKCSLFRVASPNLRELREFFKSLEVVRNIQLFGDALHISFGEEPAKEDWNKWQSRSGYPFDEWEKILPSIEDVFLDFVEGAN